MGVPVDAAEHLVRLDKTVVVFESFVGSSAIVHLENVDNGSAPADVMFKVKTNNHPRYNVRPNMGRICKGSTIAIRFILADDPPLEQGPLKDRFVIDTTLDSGSDYMPTREFWAQHHKRALIHKFNIGIDFRPSPTVPRIHPQIASGQLVHVDKVELAMHLTAMPPGSIAGADMGAGAGNGRVRLSDSVRIVNVGDEDVAFKLLATVPNRYVVRPNYGCIPQGESRLVRVHRVPSPVPDPGLSKDRIQLRVVPAPNIPDTMASHFWRERVRKSGTGAGFGTERLNFRVRFLSNFEFGGGSSAGSGGGRRSSTANGRRSSTANGPEQSESDSSRRVIFSKRIVSNLSAEPTTIDRIVFPKRIVSDLSTGSRSEQMDLVTVDKTQLQIPIEQGGSDVVRIRNSIQEPVIFKVFSSNPYRYVVGPKVATVARGAEYSVLVLLADDTEQPAPGKSDDRLQVMVAPLSLVPENCSLKQFWAANERRKDLQRVKLTVKFVTSLAVDTDGVPWFTSRPPLSEKR